MTEQQNPIKKAFLEFQSMLDAEEAPVSPAKIPPTQKSPTTQKPFATKKTADASSASDASEDEKHAETTVNSLSNRLV